MKGDYNNIYYNFFRGATNRNKSERLIFIKKYTYTIKENIIENI